MALNPFLQSAALALILVGACSGGAGESVTPPPTSPPTPSPPPPPTSGSSPVLTFVAQTPIATGASDFAVVTGTFGNHRGTTYAAPRGGSLFVQYGNGNVVDILDKAFKAACDQGLTTCEPRGSRTIDANGLLTHGVAVRAPTVHWNGDRVLFSMSLGATLEADRFVPAEYFWQIYEIEGLSAEDTPVLRKISGQPENRNNVEAVYGSAAGTIFFMTDEPITRNTDHYPQIDEYESTPTVSGLWALDTNSGDLTVLDHSPSGAFNPFVDQSGMIIYTRWDHFQADQQANAAVNKAFDATADDSFGAFTYTTEDENGRADRELVSDRIVRLLTQAVPEPDNAFTLSEPLMPEPHQSNPAYVDPSVEAPGTALGSLGGSNYFSTIAQDGRGRRFRTHRYNTFMPWQIHQDGTGHETFRHIGRHELLNFLPTSFIDDTNLEERSNANSVFTFNMSEHPGQPGLIYGNTAAEFGAHRAGPIFSLEDLQGGAHENGDAVEFSFLTDPAADTLYRDPIMMSDGRLLASVDQIPVSQKASRSGFNVFDFQLRELSEPAGGGFMTAAANAISPAQTATFDYYESDGSGTRRSFSGDLWILQAREIIPRPNPTESTFAPLQTPEQQILQTRGVSESALRDYLASKDLALIVSRNVTSRDEADRQQPFHLRVDHPTATGTAFTQGNGRCDPVEAGSCLYDIRYMQIFENKLVRGYEKRASGSGVTYSDNGRRGLARPMDYAPALSGNPVPAAAAPEASVLIGSDGSVASLVPAERAITWALEDRDGNPIVRERVWLTFQKGEVRVCASCHGVNDRNQEAMAGPTNPPEALGDLLDYLIAQGEL